MNQQIHKVWKHHQLSSNEDHSKMKQHEITIMNKCLAKYPTHFYFLQRTQKFYAQFNPVHALNQNANKINYLSKGLLDLIRCGKGTDLTISIPESEILMYSDSGRNCYHHRNGGKKCLPLVSFHQNLWFHHNQLCSVLFVKCLQ